jgi:hypothetical protein
MKRVCVLGNSHLAAVKLGWNQRAAAHPDLHCDFFGAPKNGMAEVAFEDGLIVPQNEAVRAAFAMTSGGRESVQLRDYDCVVAVGLGFSMATLIRRVYRDYRSDGHNFLDGDITLVGEDTFRQICTTMLARSTAMWLAGHLAQAGVAQRVIVPQPLPSEDILDATDGEMDATLWQAAVREGDDESLAQTMTEAVQALTAPRLAILPQPPATRAGHLFTRRDYAIGSVRLVAGFEAQHAKNDVGHMNGAYGAAVIDALAAQLRG